MADRQNLIHNWIEFQRTGKPELEWSNDDLIDLANENPEAAWERIIQIIDLEASEQIITSLAGGPMEDLLAEHGTKFLNRIEALSGNNLVFARLIKQIWIDELPTEVKNRIGAIQKKYANGM
jgi:hypothetical protein